MIHGISFEMFLCKIITSKYFIFCILYVFVSDALKTISIKQYMAFDGITVHTCVLYYFIFMYTVCEDAEDCDFRYKNSDGSITR